MVGFSKTSFGLTVWTKSEDQDQDPFKGVAMIIRKIAEDGHHLRIHSNSKTLKDALVDPTRVHWKCRFHARGLRRVLQQINFSLVSFSDREADELL